MVTAITIAALSVAACSDATRDKAENAVDSAVNDITNVVNDSTARAQAETFRGSLVAQELDGTGRRGIDTLTDAADDLPDGTVVGIEDADHDGLDDDGLVQIESNDRSACVHVAASGDVTVTDDACF